MASERLIEGQARVAAGMTRSWCPARECGVGAQATGNSASSREETVGGRQRQRLLIEQTRRLDRRCARRGQRLGIGGAACKGLGNSADDLPVFVWGAGVY